MKEMKDSLKLNIIPCIMLIISIIIVFTSEENIRKLLLIFGAFLLGIHVQRCIDYIKNVKEVKKS